MPKPYTDGDWLRRRYWGEGASMVDIADECGVTKSTVQYHMDKHGIDRRSNAASKAHATRDRAGLMLSTRGYEVFHGETYGETYNVKHHRLLALAWFGWDAVDSVVHHKNGIAWDNREENLELFDSHSDHMNQRHRDGGGRFVRT